MAQLGRSARVDRGCHDAIILHIGWHWHQQFQGFHSVYIPIPHIQEESTKMAPLTLKSTVSLPNNQELPRLGFGVWDSPSHLTTQSCLSALKTGYRHIDTAQVYGNETEVGEAVKNSGLKREEVFITSKVLGPGEDAESTYQKCLSSVQKIAGDDGYLDLFLIHNVTCGAQGVKLLWQAMERLQQEGKIKSIGLSNSGVAMIEGMKSYAKVWPPAVNQFEVCAFCPASIPFMYLLCNSFIHGANSEKSSLTARRTESQSRLTAHS